MSYPFAPEFQSSGNGYSPDKFYTKSKFGPGDERAWVTIGKQHSVPAEMLARINDLIHTQKYPAYRTIGDFMRDAIVHHLYRRLSELDDPYWARQRDIISAAIEMDRRELENTIVVDLVDRWERLLSNERDPRRREDLVTQAKEDVEAIQSDYWREKLERVVERYER